MQDRTDRHVFGVFERQAMQDRTPKRIQRRRAKGWRMPEGAIAVDRGTRWGNPFVVGQDGSAVECVRLYGLLIGRGLVCLSCKAAPEDQEAARKHVLANLPDLRGRDLACWCKPGAPCHADLLLVAANV
jgi:hypothetical protein